ncbi:MAG: AraC family transcriptional regulator [Firmicutes bacterium]|nr:AraC family transcriptional regulator [Bacillota bacterium]
MSKIPYSFVNNFDKFSFEFTRVEQQQDMPIFHFHDRYEVYYLFSGERYYFIDNRTYHVKPGNLVLIDKHTIHRTTGTFNDGYERALFYFNENFERQINDRFPSLKLFAVFHKDMHVIELTDSQRAYLEKLTYTIADECIQRQEGYQAYLEALFIQLLVYINRMSESKNLIAPKLNVGNSKINEIISFINENYMHKLTLTDITDSFFISMSYFTKTFKEATGFTFVEYLNNLRIKHAQYMLRKTDLQVSEIAVKVGFDSVTHFGRVFKSLTGVSPLRYRKTS